MVQMSVTSRPYGNTRQGPVTIFSIQSKNRVSVDIINYGATLVSLRVPTRDGGLKNVVLGYERLEDYMTDKNYLGAIVGRYANRIANGCFSIHDKNYKTPRNDGSHHLHGGPNGFNTALWNATAIEEIGKSGVQLNLHSPHLDQGYPGNLDVSVIYWLSDEGVLSIEMKATTDRPTVVNLTSHAYFNLSDKDDICDHRLKLFSSSYTPVDDGLIPTGNISPVAATPFDFRSEKTIGTDITADHPQLQVAGGYDHNFVIDGTSGNLRPVAKAGDPVSGHQLLISSTQPGVQFYSGNNLTGRFRPRAGFCLETQHFPNSPNQPPFPSVLVSPEKPYYEKIEFRVEGNEVTSPILSNK